MGVTPCALPICRRAQCVPRERAESTAAKAAATQTVTRHPAGGSLRGVWSQQLKTRVIIEGDESGAVRAYASAGKAADGFNAKVALGSEDARKAYQRLVEAIEPYRRQLRVLDEQQEQQIGRAHV